MLTQLAVCIPYRFCVLETPGIDREDNLACVLRQIVIKDQYGIVTENGFTGLEKHVHPYGGFWTFEKAPTQQELMDVCQALNYFAMHGIRCLWDIDVKAVNQFFDYYREKPLNNNPEHHVNNATLYLCVTTVSAFLCNLAKAKLVNIAPKELMRCEYRRDKRSKREVKRFVPVYSKKAINSAPGMLLRDMPEEIPQMLAEYARRYDPMIRFAIVLQSNAGLREGEALNVRQEDSPLSTTPGIRVSKRGNIITAIKIDLTREFQLRSDGVSVGRIKRQTRQLTEVYQKNLEIVYSAYQDHLKLLERTPCEADYKPMFVSRNGKAMTRQTYCKRFERLVNDYLRPALLESDDPRLSAFGQLLVTYHFTPHALRHYFSVMLAIDGLDAARIMEYRGDRSPESALSYFANKGLLREKTEQYHEIVLEGITRLGNYYGSK